MGALLTSGVAQNSRVQEELENHKKFNPMTTELPSIESMGFDVKIVKAFPYHPMPELYLCHLKRQFEKYKICSLQKKIPSPEEALKRYWRKHLILYLKREYSTFGERVPILPRNEEEFFDSRLWSRKKVHWEKHKANLIILEQKKHRFGRSKLDFAHYLQYKWMAEKKYEFFQRFTGLREEPFWREYTRSKCLNEYHWECWKIRIRYFPFNIWMFIKFKIHCHRNPWLLQIH